MEILDSFAVDDQNSIYSVALEPGFLVDVKLNSATGLIYVMENEDGSSVYDQALAGHTFPDYQYDEAAVIQLVKDAHSKTPADITSSFKIIDLELIGDLYHVGTMDISQKRNHSLEGNGLSVSNCPDEWVEITEGYTFGDYFLLSKMDAKFLDYYSLSEAEKTQIQNWAIENGYVIEGTLYKSLSWGEYGEEYFSLFDSYEAALDEADYEEEYVEKVDGLLPTQKLIDQSLVKVELLNVRDIITALYTEYMNYDGIWWAEELDVSCYSAPRGVIFNSKLPSFDVVNTSKEPEKKSSLDDKILSASSRVISESFDSNSNVYSLEAER